MSAIQGKYWCFTWNNFSLDYVETSELFTHYPDFVYLVFQCEQVTTKHYQGYVEFAKLKRLSQLKKLHPAIHWERRKGNQVQAIAYCKKEDSRFAGPWEFGTPSESHQGARTDLLEAVAALKSGGLKKLTEEYPSEFVRYSRGFIQLCSFQKPDRCVPDVLLLFGPSEVGKTRRFFDSEPADDRWSSPITDGLWFDGYYGQSAVLFDDFAGKLSKLSLANLLRIIDRYDIQLPVKGGFVWFNPKRIYITTNFHPRDWYDWDGREQQWPALKRRFSHVYWYKSSPPCEPVFISRPSVDSDGSVWNHFWDGANRAQLALDKLSGKLISSAPVDYYDW